MRLQCFALAAELVVVQAMCEVGKHSITILGPESSDLPLNTMMNKRSTVRYTPGPLLLASSLIAFALSASVRSNAAPIYHDGVSAPLSGAFEFGTYLPNQIAGTSQDGCCAPITGAREYFFDLGGNLNPGTAGSFNLVVYSFSTPKDSVRLYPSQDHYFGGGVPDSLAPEVMEYSVWGSNTGGPNPSEWTMLSNPIGWTTPVAGKPEYTFEGVAPAEIFRGGSSEGGLGNAYTQDYTFSTAYKYFGFRGSSIAMAAFTADPELDTMVAFNRRDVPISTPDSGVPLAGTALVLALCATVRSRQVRRA